jgi:hypothetical protein
MQAPIYENAMFATIPGGESESSVAGARVLALASWGPVATTGPVNAWRRVINTMIGNKC